MKIRKYKRRLIVLLAFFLATLILVPLWPKTPEPPDSLKSIADLELYLQKITNNGTPPGLSLVVVKNDSIIYSKGFGCADCPRKIAATPETVYHWWSITKITTALAILQLQEQGKLQLDDPVTKYLHFFKVRYPSAASKTITIRHLLNHSSGLPNPGPFKLIKWIHHDTDKPLNQTALVQDKMPEFSKLRFEPGEDVYYTSFGYMILGAIIEKITNQTYEDYIRQNILTPLSMNHTDFVYTQEMKTNEAAGSHPSFDILTPLLLITNESYIRETTRGHLWFERIYTDQTPSSALIGSVTDAASLAIVYFNNGEIGGHHLLSKQLIDTMSYNSYAQAKEKKTYFVRQGIGWQIYKDKHGLVLQHEGGGPGFSTSMRLYPDEKLAFILFANDSKTKGWKIINLAAKLNWY